MTRREVKRKIKGLVQDGAGNPLHGVQVQVSGGNSVYTDYDNGPRGFDGTVDGDFATLEVLVGYNRFVNGQFQAFEPSNVTLTVLAQDILGTPFTKQATVNISGLSNTGTQDGGLPAVIDQGTLALSNYRVIDANNDLHLHKDLADNSRSHKIRLNHPLASTSRYESEVRGLTRLLSSMGFRENRAGTFLQEVTTYTASAQRAVKLFRAVWISHGTSSAFNAASTTVDATALTQMNQVDGVIWTTNAPFSASNGFTYATTNNRWMHSTIPDQLAALVTKSVITDVTRADGGSGGYGQTHHAGSEVDVRWINTSGGAGQGDFFAPLSRANRRPATVHYVTGGVPDPA